MQLTRNTIPIEQIPSDITILRLASGSIPNPSHISHQTLTYISLCNLLNDLLIPIDRLTTDTTFKVQTFAFFVGMNDVITAVSCPWDLTTICWIADGFAGDLGVGEVSEGGEDCGNGEEFHD